MIAVLSLLLLAIAAALAAPDNASDLDAPTAAFEADRFADAN